MLRRPCSASPHRRLPRSRMAARRPVSTWARASEMTWQTASTGGGCRHVYTEINASALCTELYMDRPVPVCLHMTRLLATGWLLGMLWGVSTQRQVL